jgi:two-component SAPR family response regulator
MSAQNDAYSQRFAGQRILIVEDEFLLADEARRKLQKLGAVVIGPTGRVDEALELIGEEEVDAAILDVYLEGDFVFPVAEKLQSLNIPFVFATAYNPLIIPDSFGGFVLCEKPIELENIAVALFGPRASDH